MRAIENKRVNSMSFIAVRDPSALTPIEEGWTLKPIFTFLARDGCLGGRIEVPQLARDLKNMNDAWEKQALSFLYTFCSRKIQILQDHLPSFAFRLTNLLEKEKMEKHEKSMMFLRFSPVVRV